MLMFACDLHHVAEGAFRIHLNEVAIGLPLPSWAIALAQSAVPPRWHTEAILHARAYSPEEALERGIVDAVARPAERLLEGACAAAAPLATLDQAAYATAKLRHRAVAVRWATEVLESEIGRLPTGTVRA
jgi:enoyl-CoA hydratase